MQLQASRYAVSTLVISESGPASKGRPDRLSLPFWQLRIARGAPVPARAGVSCQSLSGDESW